MTSIDTLAHTIRADHGIDTPDAALDVVKVHVDQIADDPDLYDAGTGTLTTQGAELIADVISESYKHSHHATTAQQLLEAIADEATAIQAAKQTIEERTAHRDELIRAALRTELTRADIAAAATVKEARLYQIRDGRR